MVCLQSTSLATFPGEYCRERFAHLSLAPLSESSSGSLKLNKARVRTTDFLSSTSRGGRAVPAGPSFREDIEVEASGGGAAAAIAIMLRMLDIWKVCAKLAEKMPSVDYDWFEDDTYGNHFS